MDIFNIDSERFHVPESIITTIIIIIYTFQKLPSAVNFGWDIMPPLLRSSEL